MNVNRLKPRKRRPADTHSKRLAKLSDDVTEILKKIVITLLIAVVISQVAMQSGAVRRWVTGVDRLEGTSFQ
ncbi:hypothetical protein [Paenibacillus spongiae]|uniref:Uncharacterized protein n=1 Tax=Paenibacillus spongiae TaxID=2909671 RepID=A0ABY5SFD8_9BACL|nr:hypothetical protein [Paenibacillus spongiae]UVI32369.1 hypothetical protein L1F29_11350 [Paenibacillus spongiae]